MATGMIPIGMGNSVLLGTQTTAEVGTTTHTTLSESIRNFRYLAVSICASNEDYVIAFSPVDLFISAGYFMGCYTNKGGNRMGVVADYYSDTKVRLYGYVSGYTFNNVKIWGVK